LKITSRTVEGIYGKSIQLLGKNSAVVLAPGCDKKAQMVESRRYKERPHLVTPGKQKGEYRCEKTVRILMAYDFALILL